MLLPGCANAPPTVLTGGRPSQKAVAHVAAGLLVCSRSLTALAVLRVLWWAQPRALRRAALWWRAAAAAQHLQYLQLQATTQARSSGRQPEEGLSCDGEEFEEQRW